ncbi:HAMP domain-containing histidine kinase [Lachnospiraceae bacterium MD308]|nr:HAMP domain-containing histidine kinase [Lachnospiraceae bacterium MD308]MCI8580497.1 HAMP domain-containing histidine kinase [Dorea sp.]
MKLLQDKQIRYFCCFLIFFILILLGSGAWLFSHQTESVKQMLFIRENTMISVLLEQGVSEDVIAAAIANAESGESGRDFLRKIGRTGNTVAEALPEFTEFRKEAGRHIVSAAAWLSVFLMSGVFMFLWKRDRLYQKAESIMQQYIAEDFSGHLPQSNEGTIYQMFSAMDQFATMLQARGEARQKEKEFLKSTISDISHQLKTPLAALTMYQEIIAGEPDNPDTIRVFSEKMGISLKRIKQLIEAMLKITRLDAGGIVFEQQKNPVYEVVSHGINELKLRAKQENKEIVLKGDRNQTVSCDLEWTGEAIGNIVKNALDHTDSGGVVHIVWTLSPAMVRIQIKDNGSGISPEDIHHIFKRFYRGKKSLDTQGIGLGLPLAKAIVEGQKGVISVKSELGAGTTFTISFLTDS